MARSRQHGPGVVYVAGSARELPDDVRDWLGQTRHRAIASPDVYDALALLATGKSPAVLIVSIEAVDWSEMAFFDQVPRLSARTQVYVAGHEHSDAKLKAARQRGAKVFDADAIEADLDIALPEADAGPSSGLLAGSLRPAHPGRPRLREDTHQPVNVSPDRLAADEKVPDLPSVRLVASTDNEDEDDVPVPVPWAPSPRRPRRTPPRQYKDKPPAGSPDAPSDLPKAEQKPSPVVTPEELAALLGKPAPPDASSAKEQRQ